MVKMSERVEIGSFEILSDRGGICEPTDCPVRKAAGRFKDPFSLEEAEKICKAEGLRSGNDFYGAGQRATHRLEADKIIFTADCVKRVTGSAILNCGSILVQDLSIKPSDLIILTIDFIKAKWMSENNFTDF